jgi:hypothetical protein
MSKKKILAFFLKRRRTRRNNNKYIKYFIYRCVYNCFLFYYNVLCASDTVNDRLCLKQNVNNYVRLIDIGTTTYGSREQEEYNKTYINSIKD